VWWNITTLRQTKRGHSHIQTLQTNKQTTAIGVKMCIANFADFIMPKTWIAIEVTHQNNIIHLPYSQHKTYTTWQDKVKRNTITKNTATTQLWGQRWWWKRSADHTPGSPLMKHSSCLNPIEMIGSDLSMMLNDRVRFVDDLQCKADAARSNTSRWFFCLLSFLFCCCMVK